MNGNRIFALGAAFGAAGIALGAFGAHGLAETLKRNGDRAIAAWDTGAQYHMVGAFAIMASGLLAAHLRCKGPAVAASFFSAGIILFSGSLYGWSTLQWQPLVFFTPVGGLMLILGFVTLSMTSWNACGSTSPSDAHSIGGKP